MAVAESLALLEASSYRMKKAKSEAFKAIISANIEKYGHHLYGISGGPCPNFVYSIGLSKTLGFELVAAGNDGAGIDDLRKVVQSTIEQLNSDRTRTQFSYRDFPRHALRTAKLSWSSHMLLGVADYYGTSEICAMQLLPDEPANQTLDTPDMGADFNPDILSPWFWLVHPWKFEVPKDSVVITNRQALQGQPLTEVARWEENEWEMFAGPGPDVSEADFRKVTLGTMIGIDPSLEIATTLGIGKAVWRSGREDPWVRWGK